MICFFRTLPVRQAGIRRKLLAQSRITRFLVSAKGEVTLDMVGFECPVRDGIWVEKKNPRFHRAVRYGTWNGIRFMENHMAYLRHAVAQTRKTLPTCSPYGTEWYTFFLSPINRFVPC